MLDRATPTPSTRVYKVAMSNTSPPFSLNDISWASAICYTTAATHSTALDPIDCVQHSPPEPIPLESRHQATASLDTLNINSSE